MNKNWEQLFVWIVIKKFNLQCLHTPTLRSKSPTILSADILADGVRAALVELLARAAKDKKQVSHANTCDIVNISERNSRLPVWQVKALSRFLSSGVAGRDREAWTAESVLSLSGVGELGADIRVTSGLSRTTSSCRKSTNPRYVRVQDIDPKLSLIDDNVDRNL